MTAKSPACQSLLQKHVFFADTVSQQKDIDPNLRSFPSVLNLDTQISLATISGSPTSSVEELRLIMDHHAQEDCRLVVMEAPEAAVVDLHENPGSPAATEATLSGVEGAAIGEEAQTVAIVIPEETQSGSPWESVGHQGHFLEVDAMKPISHQSSRFSFPHLHGGCGCSSAHRKAVASAFVALLFVPCFLYTCYYYAPLEVITCPHLISRILLALHCLLIAGIPILLGIAFRSINTLCQENLEPLYAFSRSGLLHQVFVASSLEQFALFSPNLLVTATFLPQEQLRLIPILAGLFFLSRFCYWVALFQCSSFRSFGFGLAFFPSLGMTLYNFYCLYGLDFGFLFMPASSGYTHPTASPLAPREAVSN